MEAIKVQTPRDFSSTSPKRKKHSSIACASCRKLRIRCQGGEPPVKSDRTKPCNHCANLHRECLWPEEDGRKRPKPTFQDLKTTPTSDEASVDEGPGPPSTLQDVHRLSITSKQDERGRSRQSAAEKVDRAGRQNCDNPRKERRDSFTTIHYYRELGPTAIAPGHKQIAVKVHQNQSSAGSPQSSGLLNLPSKPDPHLSVGPTTGAFDGPLPIFEEESSLPVEDLLPSLLDAFFLYYADSFCFLNRSYLDRLLSRGEASPFLVCSIATLSSRFCNPQIFTMFYSSKADGSRREAWEYSVPFLERAKTLMTPLIGIPSCDVIAGMLLLSLAEFGNNSESGMWMFIGMALRMAQEIGLHRERPSRGRSIGQSPTNFASGDLASPKLPLELTSDHNVEIEEFEKSAQVVLFWCVYTMDVNICNGTGRVPTMKRHEISIRLPEDRDIAVIRAGPGVSMKSLKPEVYPQYAKMMLLYAKSIDFLNTSSSQVQGESLLDDVARKDRLVALKAELMESYRKIPREIRFGAIYYQAAVKSSQASPYLLLHLQYHLQIAFLSQESMAGDDVTTEPLEGTVTEDGRLNLPVDRHQEDSDKRKTDEQLYRSSIRSITDMLTFAKHIDDRALMSTFWMNQSFFHAACAYVRDMLQQRGDFPTVRDSKPVTFPIPNQTAPSLVDPFQDYSRYPEHLIPRTASSVAAESTTTYLALIAKANYQFLREAIRVVAQYYSGAGWVDAVLDQREAGLRDVDLSIVSDNISSYIRLHDLKSRTHSSNTTSKASSRQLNGNLALNNADISQKLPPLPPRTGSLPTMSSDDYSAAWADLASGFMTDNEMNWEFDPQAFFNDYMFAELANQRASALQSPS